MRRATIPSGSASGWDCSRGPTACLRPTPADAAEHPGALEVFASRFHLSTRGSADPAAPGEACSMAGDPRRWMWTEACAMIERAEQMHRQFFQPAAAEPCACWEPPIDVFEGERDLSIVVALPGVDPQDTAISSEVGGLRVAGVRHSPFMASGSAVHRLEIPYGRFERRIKLPAGRWEL